MKRQKYYAVHNGRNGTGIYTTWEEVRATSNKLDPSMSNSTVSIDESERMFLSHADLIVW